ncbi:hypothetical protein AAFC00_004446 [Neodothiora populina]|uniref:Glycosyltransferase 2-like domain-containing protein n=1 Tax=Neodothiora populina TaxID=2781224 RepID=A0ABR3P2I1_9PEZI
MSPNNSILPIVECTMPSDEAVNVVPSYPSTEDGHSSSVVSVSQPVYQESKGVADLRRCDVMAEFLHARAQRNNWLESYHNDLFYGTSNLGAFVRRPDGSYSTTSQAGGQIMEALEALQPQMAFTMSFTAISVLLTTLEEGQRVLELQQGFLLPILDSIVEFSRIAPACEKYIGACICKQEHFILVWGADPNSVLMRAGDMESLLVGKIFGVPVPPMDLSMLGPYSTTISRSASSAGQKSPSRKSRPSTSRPTTPRSRHSSASRSHRSSSRKAIPRSVSFGQPFDVRDDPMESLHMPVPPLPVFFQTEAGEASSSMNRGRIMSASTDVDPLADRISSPMNRGRFMSNSTDVDPLAPRNPTRTKSMPPEMVRRPTIGYIQSLQLAETAKAPQQFPRLSLWDHRVLQNAGISVGPDGKLDGVISHATLKKMGVLEKALEVEEMGETSIKEENVIVPDEEMQKNQKRPFLLSHSWLVAIAAGLVVTLEFWTIADLIGGTRLDGDWARWALVITIPMFSLFSLFFMIVISGCLFQLVVPVGCLKKNSVYYSAIAPKISEHPNLELPHITIQMPVYKEGLSGVIIPTVTSLLQAVRHYESYGGTATIYINDDGMQLVGPELQEARKTFYELNDIAWCSRPAQCTEPGEKFFLRKGKFKKASNMNFCLDFSLRVEAEFIRMRDAQCAEEGISHLLMPLEEEDDVYERARDRVIEQEGGRALSGGDVRIGEFILIIDSDTIVPEDCLICGALELTESPEVAIIQHASGVMNVTGSLFENGITYFTNLIYTNIVHSVGSGDVGPFVGHNAFLRWKAIQSVSYQEEGQTKFWSESHVSEDFDVSLRLQMAGFIIRLAGYHKGGFKEGVSLTVYDELARWEKYAYGCNELVFHPFKDWWRHGPITPLFRRFLGSNIKITSKFTIMAYIGTYYAIAAGLPLSIINYVLLGLGWQLDKFYQSSWHIWVGLAVIYNVVSPFSFAMLRYRTKQKSYLGALFECAKWLPLFLVFFSGLSFHLSKALLCHFFSVNMEWTTTAKEVEKTGFRLSIIRVIKDFRYMYIFNLFIAGAMIFFAFCPFPAWRIIDFTVIIPLVNQVAGHLLLPFFALGLL